MNPTQAKEQPFPQHYEYGCGLSIAEYAAIQFQAAALQGLLASEYTPPSTSDAAVAKLAKSSAEAMLKACGYVD